MESCIADFQEFDVPILKETTNTHCGPPKREGFDNFLEPILQLFEFDNLKSPESGIAHFLALNGQSLWEMAIKPLKGDLATKFEGNGLL